MNVILKISNENLSVDLMLSEDLNFMSYSNIVSVNFVLILFTNIISKVIQPLQNIDRDKNEFNDKVQPEMFKQMSDTEINKLVYTHFRKNIYSNFPDIEKTDKKIIKLFSIEFEKR